MAKKVTEAHRRHTKTSEGSAVVPLSAEKIAALRKGFQEMNRLPETWLDRLERLATLPNDSDGHNSEDKKRLLVVVKEIRGHVEKGDARQAAYVAIEAGVILHKLGWSEKDADFGREALRNIEEKKEKQRARWPKYQAAVDAVRAEFPDMDKHAVKVTAAERCGVKWDTIHRRTEWL